MNVVSVINRGGFGRVEKVSRIDGSFIARKVFDPSADVIAGADIEKLKKRFKREVRVQSSLSSDFFVPVVSYDLNAEPPWFSMPLCDRNYSDQIQEDKTRGLVSQQALADILNALEELHSLGYTHRDLKPQNILIHEGRWKLSDFGLVMPPTGETTKLTSKDSVWGTQMYCAPEQLQDFRSVTPLADLYSFGCILHDIFADGIRVPFQRHTCLGPLGLIIEKCTEPNPQRRFKSVAALRGLLLSILAQPIPLQPSAEATDWVAHLQDMAQWDTSRIRDLARYIHSAEVNDLWVVCQALDEDKLKELMRLDADYWEAVAISYCGWAFDSSFNFEYCDVVIGRLECIFEIGSLDCKAAAALAAAELGVCHNRWYVMRRLLVMCGLALDDTVAKRIAIEIVVEEVQRRFISSADAVGSVSEFHPLIREVLERSLNRDS